MSEIAEQIQNSILTELPAPSLRISQGSNPCQRKLRSSLFRSSPMFWQKAVSNRRAP
jgi:hypothetical protein